MRLSMALFIPLAMGASAAYAGAWTQSQGEMQVILTASNYSASEMYDNNGRLQPQAGYRKYELDPYIEYGYSDDITLGTSLSLQNAMQDSGNAVSQTNWGLGDSEFFIRKRLWQGDGFVISAEPLIKLPSPESSVSDDPKLGGSHPDIAMGLSGGYGFSVGGLNHFIDIDTQYRYRFGPSKDQVKIDATAGIGITEKWMLMPQAFVTLRTSKPMVATFTESSGDDYDLLRLQLSAVYKLTPETSLQFGGYYDVDGKNTGQGKGFLLAVWKHF